jgi:hypothetical protein
MNTIVPLPQAVFEYMPSGFKPGGLTKRFCAMALLLSVSTSAMGHNSREAVSPVRRPRGGQLAGARKPRNDSGSDATGARHMMKFQVEDELYGGCA